MQKIFQWMAVLLLCAGVLLAAEAPAASLPGQSATVPVNAAQAPNTPPKKALIGGIEPGYRSVEIAQQALKVNPFEPVTDVRSDVNSEAAQAMLKRIKGYVVQANGSPLLVIDDKSYRVKDKVPMNASADATKAKDPKAAGAATPATGAAPVGGETVTILSITPTEAVFQKDDPSGFGGESFKIYFNFKHEVDDTGKTNYNLWESVGNGFFVNEDGVLVVPLSIAQSSELSVKTPYGYSRATLVESDSKRGLGLLKVEVKSIPLYLAQKKAMTADAVFPAGYSIDQKIGLRFLEGFLTDAQKTTATISPEVDGSLLGAVVLNAEAEVVGVLVGDTEKISNVLLLSPDDNIFRKYAPSKRPETGKLKTTRATIEQSIVKIYRKK